jgi:capsid protein
MPVKAQAVIVDKLQRAKAYSLCSEATIREAIRVINIPAIHRSPADNALVRELSRIFQTLGDIEG